MSRSALLKSIVPDRVATSLVFLVAFAAAAFLLMLASNHVYVSSRETFQFLKSTGSPVWDMLRMLHLRGMDDPGPILVERVDISHIIPNALFAIATSAIFVLAPFFAVGLVLVMIVFGLLTSDWGMVGKGVFLGLLAPLSLFVALFMPLAIWIEFLFQACTPAYALIWVVIGFPSTLALTLFPAASEARIIAVIFVFK